MQNSISFLKGFVKKYFKKTLIIIKIGYSILPKMAGVGKN